MSNGHNVIGFSEYAKYTLKIQIIDPKKPGRLKKWSKMIKLKRSFIKNTVYMFLLNLK